MTPLIRVGIVTHLSYIIFVVSLFLHHIDGRQNGGNRNVCETPRCQASAEMLLRNMDETMSPCHDFYQYACGNFNEEFPMPSYANRYTMFIKRDEDISEKITEFFQNPDEDSSAIEKMRTYYTSCISDEVVDRFGDFPIPTTLTTVGLPVRPPFLTESQDITGPTINFSRILARMSKYANINFLISYSVVGQPPDYQWNLIQLGASQAVGASISRPNVPSEKSENQHSGCFTDSHIIELKFEDKDETLGGVNFLKIHERFFTILFNYMVKLTNMRFSPSKMTSVLTQYEEMMNFFTSFNGQVASKKYPKVTEETISIAALQQRTDEKLKDSKIKIKWMDFFEEAFEDVEKITPDETIKIVNTDNLNDLLQLIANTSEDVLLRSLWFLTVRQTSRYTNTNQRKYVFNYIRKTNGQTPSISETCIQEVRDKFSHLVGHILTRNEHSLKDKQHTAAMVNNIKNSFSQSIASAPWLDTGTRMAALNKLDGIGGFISYDNWLADIGELDKGYENVFVSKDSFYTTVMYSKTNSWNGRLRWLHRNNGKYYGRFVDPGVVNAAYRADMNAIDVPIGILGLPFSGHGLQALNYGGIGSVIGHELVHAFDNNGKNYNTWGAEANWWRKKTARKFDAAAKCFIDDYDKVYFKSIDKHVNGQLTLPENIADNGGFHQALMAYRKYVRQYGEEPRLIFLEHLSPERLFTLAYANMYCENRKPGNLRAWLESEVHSPGYARVNAVVRNSVEFARIWNCKSTAKMNNPKKCKLW